MIVLDTNVVSEWMRPVPSDAVIEWMTRQMPTDLYLSTITEAEMRFGVELLFLRGVGGTGYLPQ